MGITIIIIVCLIYFCIKKTNKNSIKNTIVNDVWKRLEMYELLEQYIDSTNYRFYHFQHELSGIREEELTPELKERLKTILGYIREDAEEFSSRKKEARKYDSQNGIFTSLSSEAAQYLTKLEAYFVRKYIQRVNNKAYGYECGNNHLMEEFNKTMEHFGISEKDLG